MDDLNNQFKKREQELSGVEIGNYKLILSFDAKYILLLDKTKDITEAEPEIVSSFDIPKKGFSNKFRNEIVKELVDLDIIEKRKDAIKIVSDAFKSLRKGYNERISEQRTEQWGEKQEDENEIYTSLYINEEKHIIAEQICDNNINKFCVYNTETKEINYKDCIIDDITYNPIIGEEILKGAILLPSKAEEYGTDEKLDKEILTFISKWLDIPDDVKQFALWNIKRSWVYERFHTLNYLRALGDTGVGKTRFLDVLGHIHYKPIETSGATTSAPVFRVIDKWRGTLIMDEADFSKSDESQDIIKIINMGYEKGKFVMRCDQNDASKINFFDPYCPKILATRRTFQDKATESRCITQVMKETTRKDIPYNLNDDFFSETQTLRNKLLMWRFRNYYKINPDKSIDLELDLEPRVKQIVVSFVSMFCDDEKQLEKFKVFIKNYQEELIEERRNSYYGGVVSAIHDLLEESITAFSGKDIIEKGSLEVKPRSMSSILKMLGFKKTIMKKVDGQVKRCIPLEKEMLTNLFKRYGNEVTVVTAITEISKNILNYENEPKTHKKTPHALRNTVTTDTGVTTVTSNLLDAKTIKTTLFTMFAMQPEIEVQQFLTRFPENFHSSIDIMLDGLKEKGEIFECKPGWIKML